MFVGCGCLQWITAASVAWQQPVPTLKDGACSIGIMGLVGSQRTVAGVDGLF